MTGEANEDPLIQFLTFAEVENSAKVEAGDLVDGYRLLEEIGAGGSGVVFRAKHLELDREVAFKISHHEVKPTSEVDNSQGSYQQEARILAELRHPNLVPVYDAGVHAERRWLAMQYVPGTKLRPISHVEQAVCMLRKLAAALGTAHASGIAHGDLRPANVMLSQSGEPMLIDFSLATASASVQTKPSSPLGTPRYWAPEQRLGYGASIASDVYSFGLLALFTLTGDLTPRTLKKRELPRSLRAILQHCLARRISDRYANAVEIAAELQRFLANEAVLADSRGAAARIALAIRRRPGRAGAIFSLTTLILLSLVLWQHQRVLDSRLESVQLQDDIDEAYAIFDQGDLPRLFAMHEKVDSRLGSDPRWLLLIAGANLWSRRYTDAAALYLTYESAFPNDVGAEYADIAQKLDQLRQGPSDQAALLSSNRSIQDANFQEAFVSSVTLARLSIAQQEQASAWAARGLELRPNCFPLLLVRGRSLIKFGHRSQGIACLTRASHIAQLPIQIEERLIQSLISSSRLREAHQRIELAKERYADNPLQKLRICVLNSQLAIATGSHIKIVEAHRQLSNSQEVSERTYSSEFAFINIETLLGQWDSAHARLTQLGRRLDEADETEIPQQVASRHRSRIRLLHAQLLAARDNTRKALSEFDSLLESRPHEWIASVARLDQVACLSRIGQSEQALNTLQQELKRGAGFEAGTRLAVRNGDLDYAAEIAKRGLAEDPTNPRRIAIDSYVAFANDDLHHSMVQAETALRADPDSMKFRLWQAYVLARTPTLAQNAEISIEEIDNLPCWLAWDRIVQIAALIELNAPSLARHHFDRALQQSALIFLQESALQLPRCPAKLHQWLEDAYASAGSD